MVERLKDFFKIDDSYKINKRLCIVILITSILTYGLLIINYHACPDGVIEGISYFGNADWSLQGGGRWFVRYINLFTGNLVLPLIVVIQYSICSFISVLLLRKLWTIESNIILYLSGIILVCAPTTIFLMTYTYTALCIGISVLLGILFVYINFCYKNKLSIVFSIVLMMLLLATDQGFIGVASIACLLTIIIKLLRDDYKDVLVCGIKSLVTAVLGGIVYMISLKIALSIHHLSAIDNARLGGFSFGLILKQLPIKFIETYTTLINYFNDSVLKRNYLFILMFVVSLVIVVIKLIKLIKEKKYLNVILVCVFVLLIPPISYVIEIIVPYYTVYLPMEYQSTIIIVFMIVLTELVDTKVIKFIQIITVTLICWTYILSANATYRCFEISYNHINSEMNIVLNNIYNTEGYEKNKTPIIIAGFPNDKVVRENDKTYYYAIDYPKNPVFWEDMNGATIVRKNYFMYYFGIDAKDISYDEYYKVVTSKEFEDMSIWPTSNSVKMIDGYCVVKFSNNPPLPY